MAESFNVQAVLSAVDRGFSSVMDKAKSSMSQFDSQARTSSGSMATVGGSITGLIAKVAAFAGGAAVMSGAISRFDTLNKYPVVMRSLGYSANDANKSMRTLSSGIEGLPTSLDEITKSAQQLGTLTGGANAGAKAAVALNDAFLASGASAGDASRGLQQYTQMLASGKVDMMSWRTLQETMPIALRKTAAAFGFTGRAATQDLYKALQSGSITMDQLNKKFVELDKGQNGFASLAKKNSAGIATSFTNLKNAAVKGMAGMLTAIDQGLANAGLPSMAKMIDSLKGTVNTAFAVIDKSIASAIPVIIGFLKALAPIVQNKAFQTMAISVLTFIVAFQGLMKVVSIISSVGNAVMGLFTLIAANPMIALVAAIIAVVAALVFFFTQTKLGKELWANFVNFLKSAWQGLVSIAVAVWNAISNAFTTVVNVIKVVWSGIVSFFSGLWNGIVSIATSIWSGVEATWSSVVQVFQSVWNTISSFFSGLWSSVVTIATSAWSGFMTSISPIVDSLKNLWSSLTAFFSTLWSGIVSLTTAIWSGITGVFTSVANMIKTVFAPVGAFFSTLWNGIVTVTTTVWNSITTVIQGVWTAITTVVTTYISILSTVITTGLTIIQTIWTAIWTTLQLVLTTIWTAIQVYIQTVITIITTIITTGLTIIQTIWTTVWTVLSTVVTAIWTIIVTIISTFINMIASVIQAVTAVIQGNWSAAWSAVLSIASAIWNAISSVISTVINAIRSIISAGINAAKAIWTSVLNAMKTVVSTVWNSIRSLFTSGVNFIKLVVHVDLSGAGRAIMQSLLDELMAVWNNVKSFVSGIAGWIKSHKGPVSYDAKLLIPAGNAIMTGLNKGLVDQFETVKSTVSSMAGIIADQLQVKAPTVDTSDLTNGLNSIQSLSASTVAGSFSGSMTLDDNGINQMNNGLLRKLLDKKQDVYLDGDKVVGGIRDRMDQSLGNNVDYGDRWS